MISQRRCGDGRLEQDDRVSQPSPVRRRFLILDGFTDADQPDFKRYTREVCRRAVFISAAQGGVCCYEAGHDQLIGAGRVPHETEVAARRQGDLLGGNP